MQDVLDLVGFPSFNDRVDNLVSSRRRRPLGSLRVRLFVVNRLTGKLGSALAAALASSPQTDRALLLVASASFFNTLGSMTSWAIGRYVPHRVPVNDAVDRLRRWGAPGLALAWVPVIGDVLPLAAGWLRIGFWPALLWPAAAKTARYSVMALALLGVF